MNVYLVCRCLSTCVRLSAVDYIVIPVFYLFFATFDFKFWWLDDVIKMICDLQMKRQQRKLNFLITQTELYAHFMARKIHGEKDRDATSILRRLDEGPSGGSMERHGRVLTDVIGDDYGKILWDSHHGKCRWWNCNIPEELGQYHGCWCSGHLFLTVFPLQFKFRWKFHFTLISILIQWLLQNFVHGTTAVLSWHVQKFVAIWWPATELQEDKVSIEFELLASTAVVLIGNRSCFQNAAFCGKILNWAFWFQFNYVYFGHAFAYIINCVIVMA